MKSEILVVEDERALREGMKGLLSGEGYAVRTARDGEDALAKIDEQRPDLALLDVMMPKMNGFRCCEEIRRTDPLLPVVFLTAKDSEADQVRGLGLGGDDYVSKDAGEAVLLARINRVLARVEAFDASSPALRLGRVRVNLEAQVIADGRRETRLTRSECDLIRLLASSPGRFFSKDEIVIALRGRGFACEDTLIYSHVHNVRQKLGPAADCLACDRMSGYKLTL